MRVLLLAVAILAGPLAAAQNSDACGLISAATIQKTFGEAVKDARPTSQTKGDLHLSECFYTLPTFTNSISVSLTAPNSSRGDGARELWQRWFHKAEDKDKQAAGPGESEEEEATAKATPVNGVGDEAFWVHSFVGNLYVRKGDEFIRISLGGKLTDEQRLEKAKALAADALQHMASGRKAQGQKRGSNP